MKPTSSSSWEGTLTLDSYSRSRHQLSFCYWVDSLRFTDSYWYDNVDFYELEERYGQAQMGRIYFHLLAFEAMKAACLKPKFFDLGQYSQYYTECFDSLWHEIFDHTYAQWRYENNLPFYKGPTIVNVNQTDSQIKEIPLEPIFGETDVLASFGGGKDSLVLCKLLERADISFSCYSYAGTAFGNIEKQFSLIENLLKHTNYVRFHRNYGYGDYLNTPVVRLYPEYGVKTQPKDPFLIPPPTALFTMLPLVLQYGYRYIIVGNERSADTGNLIWQETGEEINHQWSKTTQSDRLIADYVRAKLIKGLSYFSLLKPIYDPVIFNLLSQDSHAFSDTHSCNFGKPWCERCAKCAYVYLSAMAYLPQEKVRAVFQNNLFDLPENQIWYRQMLGLEEHKAFECVGEIEEVRLAFEICRQKGLTGQAINMFINEVPPQDYQKIVKKYTQVNSKYELPQDFIAKIFPQMEAAASSAQELIAEQLK
ncbi:MAG: hypothetical protein F6K21_07110 [Symploca sp. SIO2D2]|nr:hypothetical protein [Symploca sp. SIO2D2]